MGAGNSAQLETQLSMMVLGSISRARERKRKMIEKEGEGRREKKKGWKDGGRRSEL